MGAFYGLGCTSPFVIQGVSGAFERRQLWLHYRTGRPVGRQQVYHSICALRCRSVSLGFWLPKIRVLKDEATEIVVWLGECSIFRAEHQSRQFELAPMSCGRCFVQPDSVGSVPAVVPSAAPARGRPG